MNDKQLNHAIVSQTIDSGLLIVRLLGGNGLAGLALVEAFYTDEPWLSAMDVAKRVGILSDDTARRQLNELVAAGRAETTRKGKSLCFRIVPDVAKRIVSDLIALEQVDRILRSTATCGEPGVDGGQPGI